MEVNILAIVYMISGFTTRFGAMWLIDNKGLGTGVTAPSALLTWRYLFLQSLIALVVGCDFGLAPSDMVTLGCCWGSASAQSLSPSSILLVQRLLQIGFHQKRGLRPPLLPKYCLSQTAKMTWIQGPIFVAVLLSYAVTPRVVKVYNMHYYLLVQAIAMMMATVLIFAFFRFGIFHALWHNKGLS